MARGYVVGIASETKAFKQGVQSGIIQPVEDARDALDDLGKSRGPEQIERDLKDAQKATERLQDETKDTARAIEREFRDSYRSMKESSDDATDKAKRGLDEVKDESNSTAKEAAASFDGSAESIVDAFQEVAANAFAGFGPAGALAGLAAAAGLGTAMSAITAQQEAVDELKQRFEDAYRTAAEEGRTFLDEAQIQAAALDIMFDTEKRTKAVEDAQVLGITTLDLIRAQAGDQDALNLAIEAGRAKYEELGDEVVETADSLSFTGGQEAGRLGTVGAILDTLRQQKGVMDEQSEAARLAKDFQEESAKKERDDIRKISDANAARYQAQADAIAGLRGQPPIDVPVSLDTSGADAAYRRFAQQHRSIRVQAELVNGQGRIIQ